MGKKKIILAFTVVSLLLILSGCGCKPASVKQYSLQLEVWGLFDDRDAYSEIFDNFMKLDPNITKIDYKKMSQDTYKKDLLDALASGQGPDIFLIRNNWLPAFKDKVMAAPVALLNEQKYKSDFVDVAATDFIDNHLIYAAPLSVDSLSLYYNKDLFNEAGIANPPKSWEEFQNDVLRLTKYDAAGQITQPGAALGTTENINRATDILNLLMLQSGSTIVDKDNKRGTLDQIFKNGNDVISPAESALKFYTQFANRQFASYTWNPTMHYSIDAFSEGKLAMMFNYSWQIPVIQGKSPKLNFGVAPVPQFANSPALNFPNYWAYAVAKNKVPVTGIPNQAAPNVSNDTRAAEAWKLLKYLTTKPDQALQTTANVAGTATVTNSNYDPAKQYLLKTNKPSARRDLIEQQKSDPWLGVFAQQNLIAKDWYQADADATENIFTSMINQVNQGQATIGDAIRSANIKLTQLMNL